MSHPPSDNCRDMFEPGWREREAALAARFAAAIPMRKPAAAYIHNAATGEAHLVPVIAVDFFKNETNGESPGGA